MTTTVIVFLGVALFAYVLLGGADFGAGILELFTGDKGMNAISKAIAPVWEANHVWLIIVLVVLFVGFPPVYSTITMALHIPLMLLLLGIIFRGASFTFRYYDIKEERIHRVYTRLFKFSSLFTPIFLGVSLGAIILGRISTDTSQGFYTVFMDPWLNVFCFSMGIFVAMLFAFLASLYMLGEDIVQQDHDLFKKYSKRMMIALVVSGGLVFLAAEFDGAHLFDQFIHSPVSIGSIILASILLPFLWRSINRHNKTLLRIIGGAQTFLVLLGWFAIQYPVLVHMNSQPDITVSSAQAPAATMLQLLVALVVGLLLVIPAFLYLFKVFKFGKSNTEY